VSGVAPREEEARTLRVSINGQDVKVSQAGDLRRLILQGNDRYHDVEMSASESGPFLTALINGPVGWLMYMAEPGDAGFHSVNRDYSGNPNASIAFILANGQKDRYPASWVLPAETITAAIEEFWVRPQMSEEIDWEADG
jgi:hypothetical protein